MSETSFEILKNDPNRLLDKHTIAYMLAMSVNTVSKRIEAFKGSFKHNGKWVMQYKDVVEMIENMKKEGTKYAISELTPG